jgi:hypothetical protein
VTSLFCNLVDSYELPGGQECKADFLELRQEFHALRKYRNSLLHSAFVELKAGDDVVGLVRSHPYIYVYTDTGELVVDEEAFTSESVSNKIGEIGRAAFRLGQHYVQLVHWQPFERFRCRS